VENLAEILAYGVMSTPAVMVDGKLVHVGGVPTKAAVESWLAGSSGAGCGCCGGKC
jgi:predicted thioredoxin/glutaredoxin